MLLKVPFTKKTVDHKCRTGKAWCGTEIPVEWAEKDTALCVECARAYGLQWEEPFETDIHGLAGYVWFGWLIDPVDIMDDTDNIAHQQRMMGKA